MDDDSSKGGCGCCGGRRKKQTPAAKSPPKLKLQEMPQSAEPKSDRSERSERSVSSPSKSISSGAGVSTDPNMQLAAGQLGLTAEEQEHVAKALQAEMERRRRWKLLLRAKGLRRKGRGKKKAPSIEDILGGGLLDAPPAADLEAEVEKSLSLEDKRQEWIKKMSTGGGGGAGKDKADKKKKKSHKNKNVEEQPESISIDADQAKEIGSHNLAQMLEKILIKSKEQHASESTKTKPPSEMTPEELVASRSHNPRAWDELTGINSVASFGLAKPTDEDKNKAKLVLEQNGAGGKQKGGNKRSRKVRFDKQMTVASVPAGEDFNPHEQLQIKSARVSYQPDALKKQ